VNDLQQCKRWCGGKNGNFQAVATIERWQRMPEYQKQNLRRKWAKEDAAKTLADGKK